MFILFLLNHRRTSTEEEKSFCYDYLSRSIFKKTTIFCPLSLVGADNNHRAFRFQQHLMHRAAEKEVMKAAFPGASHPDK
jgi:hypothetical protein